MSEVFVTNDCEKDLEIAHLLGEIVTIVKALFKTAVVTRELRYKAKLYQLIYQKNIQQSALSD